MKDRLFLNILLAGAGFVAILPVAGITASVESEVKEYMQEKNPRSITEYPEVFKEVYKKYAPAIEGSTLATVVYYFSESDKQTLKDISMLANQAVTAAISNSRSDTDEDDLSSYITGAVCGSFRGSIRAAYKQATSAGQTVEGGLQAALDSGVKPDYAATAVIRGIDTCLQGRLENDVISIIGGIVGSKVPGFGYIAPYQAYLPPTLGAGDVDLFRRPPTDFPGPDTDICVSNCI
ncbi:hypothetical protein BMS3Bbin11_01062 [bacterium BMS3Bbin11]|nr:hypothetical protein BMS3Abin11_01679 [bacterium BMS3Abin11]GBE45969.1 hypothetical protein BMS3Bbin11_01062 [bacterium BMS3Bbin11]HDH14981.1 hypothetical protein [Gammaproteobacteria bacterium]